VFSLTGNAPELGEPYVSLGGGPYNPAGKGRKGGTKHHRQFEKPGWEGSEKLDRNRLETGN